MENGASVSVDASLNNANELFALVEDPKIIISEATLLNLNKGLLKKALTTNQFGVFGTSTNSYLQIWDALLRTARNPLVSNAHLTGACNAICGFLAASSSSTSRDLQDLGQADNTWLAAFDIYLLRYGDTKSKVMTQLLSTLSKRLSKNSDAETAKSIRRTFTRALLDTIFSAESVPSLKPSIIALELFLRKQTLQIDHLLDLVCTWLERLDLDSGWNKVAIGDLLEPYTDLMRNYIEEFGDCSDHSSRRNTAAEAFSAALLVNCFQPEMASVAAQLLSSLLNGFELCESVSEDDKTLGAGWVYPLRDLLRFQPGSLPIFKRHVFPVLFKSDSSHFYGGCITNTVGNPGGPPSLTPELELELLFAVHETGKNLGHELGPIEISDQGRDIRASKSGAPSLDFLYRHMFHSSPRIRLSATSLMVTSSQVTTPLSIQSLDALKKTLFLSHSDPNPEVRSEILSLERRLIIRIRGAISTLDKLYGPSPDQSPNYVPPKEHKDQRDLLNAHSSFIQWYVATIAADLCPSVAYQKHISALKALLMLVQSGLDERVSPQNLSKLGHDQLRWPIHLPILGKILSRNLLDLLLDPFDDVRSAALDVLKISPIRCKETQAKDSLLDPKDVEEALSRAEDLVRQTGRADHADGVARLHYLMFHIRVNVPEENGGVVKRKANSRDVVERILGVIENANVKALSDPSTRGFSAHGYLSSLRYLVLCPDFASLFSSSSRQKASTWRHFQARCMRICSKIWIDVREILCIDSPEGQTDDETDYDLGLGPKDLLSASWRALKEASLLLQAILLNCPDAATSLAFGLSLGDIETIGELCFTQLAELRHRGAFSTVSQTFAACCCRCERSKYPNIKKLPAKWLDNALIIIDEQASKLTRRSAGIPAILSGVVSANPGGPLFLSAMDKLSKLAQMPSPGNEGANEIRLPQVHALNCLKDIVMNSKLGASTEPFISALVEISVQSIDSKSWAIRNCGLMLLRALISRMCHSSHLKTEDVGDDLAKISFDKFPFLSEIVSGLLDAIDQESPGSRELKNEPSDQLQTTQKTFVALELIRRRYSSVGIDTRTLGLVMKQTSNENWDIREQAAKAYASQIGRSDYILVAKGLLSKEWPNMNALHGALLSTKYIVQTMVSTSGLTHRAKSGVPLPTTATEKFISVLQTANIYRYEILGYNCPYAAATFWDIVCELLEHLIKLHGPCNYLPTLKPECEFPNEYNWMKNEYGRLSLQPLFLGFTKPSALPPLSQANGSYLRFLCLCFIIDQPSDDVSSILDLIQSLDAPVSRVLSGFEQLFDPPMQMSRNRLALYSCFLREGCNEEQNVLALKNIADLYQRMPAQSLNGQSILLESFCIENFIFPWLDFPRWDLPTGKVESREISDTKLCLEGTYTAMEYAKFCQPGPETKEHMDEYVAPRLRRWVKKLQIAGNERNESSTRYSAVCSIEAFRYALRSPNESARISEPFLDVYLALYDTLNDDEEDIRNLGAQVTSWVVGGPNFPTADRVRGEDHVVSLLPLAASSRLSEFLVANYETSPALLYHAIGRLVDHRQSINSSTDASSPLSERLRPVHALLFECRQANTDLFAEEKQNLYIDEAQEVAAWSNVLTELSSRSKSLRNTLKLGLVEWATAGIQCLTETAQEEGIDGPLGWTSNPEVFVLGLRVLHTAKVILQSAVWTKIQAESQNETGSLCVDALVKGLKDFLEQGQSVRLQHHWIDTADTWLIVYEIALEAVSMSS